MASETDKIFLIQADGEFGEVERTPYESEDLLQRLLEQHPGLLAGDMLSPGNRAQFLLVGREVGVPDAEGSSDRWALDHLFLDQDATPTLVEVKRSTDSRIRREVVGQMLDYAANAQKYWPVERIRSLAEQSAGGGEQLTQAVTDIIGKDESDQNPEERVDQFWTQAAENLRTGKVRLVFVADAIPPELKRIIEFLNEQMPRVHVVGLELVQYHASGLRILVPRVVGQTEAAVDAKRPPKVRLPKTNREAFLARCTLAAQSFFGELLDQANSRGLEVYWGEQGFSVRLREELHGRRGSFLYGWPPLPKDSDPVFEIYLHTNVFRGNESDDLRNAVVQAGGFTAAGDFTLRIPVKDATAQAARAGLKVMLDWEETVRMGSSRA